MLEITVPGVELFNEETLQFTTTEPVSVRLEHSLISLSKWEEKWCVPFLVDTRHSTEEIMDYFRCMAIEPLPDDFFLRLTSAEVTEINNYISDSRTATTIREIADNTGKTRERVTAELIYYWMTALNIPFECETWHLSRLLTLIKVASIKNNPQKEKKRPTSEIMAERERLNRERMAQYNTTG